MPPKPSTLSPKKPPLFSPETTLHQEICKKITHSFLADLAPVTASTQNVHKSPKDIPHCPKLPSIPDLPTPTEADLLAQVAIFEEWLNQISPQTSLSFFPQRSSQFKWNMDILTLGLLTNQPIPIIERLLLLLQEQIHIISVFRAQIKKNPDRYASSPRRHPEDFTHSSSLMSKLKSSEYSNISDTHLSRAFDSTEFIPPFIRRNLDNIYDTSIFTIFWPRLQRFVFSSIFMHYPTLLQRAMPILFESNAELFHPHSFHRFFRKSYSSPPVAHIYRPLLLDNIPSYQHYDKYINDSTMSLSNWAKTLPFESFLENFSREQLELTDPQGASMQTFSEFHSANLVYLPTSLPKIGAFKNDYEQHLLIGNEPFFKISHPNPKIIPRKFTPHYLTFSSAFLFTNPIQAADLPWAPQSNTDSSYTPTKALLNGHFSSSLVYYRHFSTKNLSQILSPITQYIQTTYSTPINSLSLYNLSRNGAFPTAMNPRLFGVHPNNIPLCDKAVVTNYPIFLLEQTYKYQPTPMWAQNRPILYPLLDLFCDYIKTKYNKLSLVELNDKDISNNVFKSLPGQIVMGDRSLAKPDCDQLLIMLSILFEIQSSFQSSQPNSHFDTFFDILFTITLPCYNCNNSPPALVPFIIFCIVTLLPPTDGYIVPYFSHLLPYVYNQESEILWDIVHMDHLPTLSEVCLAVYSCMADIISYPSLFQQSSTVFEHRTLITNSSSLNSLYYRSQKTPLHARQSHCGEENKNDFNHDIENSFSLLSYLLCHHNVDNLDVFFDLFQATQQFELTQPVTFCHVHPELALKLHHNHKEPTLVHKYVDLLSTSSKLQQHKPAFTIDFIKHNLDISNAPKHTLLLSILISRRYHGAILQFFLNLDGIDYDYVDDYNMTVLDYCIIFNTFSYAPDFVLGVVERTTCSFFVHSDHLSNSVASAEGGSATSHDICSEVAINRLKKRLKLLWNPLLYKLRGSRELERINFFHFPQLFSYIFELFLFHPIDSPLPFELLNAIASKQLKDEHCDLISDDILPTDQTDEINKSLIYQKCEKFLPLILTLVLTRCENLIENPQNQTFLIQILSKYLALNHISGTINTVYLLDQDKLDQMKITIVPRYNDDEYCEPEDPLLNQKVKTLKSIPIEAMLLDQNGSTIDLLPHEFYEYTYNISLINFNIHTRGNLDKEDGKEPNLSKLWTVFDRIYLIYFLIDSNLEVNFVKTLIRTIPAQFMYFLFHFYQIPPDLALRHALPSLSSLQSEFPSIFFDLNQEIPQHFVQIWKNKLQTNTDVFPSLSRQYYSRYISLVTISDSQSSTDCFIWNRPLYLSSIHNSSGNRFSNWLYSTYFPRLNKIENHFIELTSRLSFAQVRNHFTHPNSIHSSDSELPPPARQLQIMKDIIDLFTLGCTNTHYSHSLMNPIYRNTSDGIKSPYLCASSLTPPFGFALGTSESLSKAQTVNSPRIKLNSPFTSTPYFDSLNTILSDELGTLPTTHQKKPKPVPRFASECSTSLFCTIKDNISPTLVDLVLSKPQYLAYFDVLLSDTPVINTKLVELDPTNKAPSINLIHSSYLIQFYSQIMCDIHSSRLYFNNSLLFHPPAAANIWNNFRLFLSPPNSPSPSDQSASTMLFPFSSPTHKQNVNFFPLLAHIHQSILPLFPTIELQPHILSKQFKTQDKNGSSKATGKPHHVLIERVVSHIIEMILETTQSTNPLIDKTPIHLRLPPFNLLQDEASKLLGNTTKRELLEKAHADFIKSCQIPRYKSQVSMTDPLRTRDHVNTVFNSINLLESHELSVSNGARRAGKG
jgi:hypothetical protein